MPRRVDVRGLREKHGLSQPELARQLGVSERSVRRWEVETVDPSPLAHKGLRALQSELEARQSVPSSAGQSGPVRKKPTAPTTTDESSSTTVGQRIGGRPHLGGVLPLGRS